jgi:ribosomal protein S8E
MVQFASRTKFGGQVFGHKKKENVLEHGTQARAVVVDVADTGMTINNNPRVQLTLQVQPEGQAPFEAKKKVTVSRVAIPSIGDTYFVRFDPANPSEVEFDTAKAQEVNNAAKAQLAEVAASAVPPDLMQNGIIGRGALVSVEKNPIGNLIDCAMTVGVRLVDGTPSYQAQTRLSLSAETAAQLMPHQTLFTVRADPNDHSRIAASLQETTPTVTISDPSVVDPPARAMRDGVPCRVKIIAHGNQFLKLPTGEVLYATKVQVVGEVSEFQIFLPVPDSAGGLLQDGAELPAKRLAAEPNVLIVDWAAAAAAAQSQPRAVLA